jgi:hypothetical protein
MVMTTDPPLADDLLIGAAAIALFIFGDENQRRRIYSPTSQLPVFRLGNLIYARKSALRQNIEQREAAAVAAPPLPPA